MTQVLDTVQKWVAFDEGCELTAYWDSIGNVWTVGYGHTGRDVGRDTVWTQDEAEHVLLHDLVVARKIALDVLAPRGGLTGVRTAAITNMAFNLGFKLWKFNTFLDLARAEKWNMASADLLGNTLWAKQLPARAHRVAIALATNEWPEVA